MTLSLRAAVEADLPLLAKMNKHLIEDEGSTNPMSLDKLEARMAGWMHSDWQIQLLLEDDQVVGYAVYQFQHDPYRPEREEVYVRQFFIERDRRKQGLGTRGFRTLARACFPPDCRITLGVLATNPNGYAFWSSLGFAPYYTAMQMQNRDE